MRLETKRLLRRHTEAHRERSAARVYGTVCMCEQCKSIDSKIAHYRELAKQITDPQSLKGIDLLTEKMEAEKRTLHPEQPS